MAAAAPPPPPQIPAIQNTILMKPSVAVLQHGHIHKAEPPIVNKKHKHKKHTTAAPDDVVPPRRLWWDGPALARTLFRSAALPAGAMQLGGAPIVPVCKMGSRHICKDWDQSQFLDASRVWSKFWTLDFSLTISQDFAWGLTIAK